MKHIEADIITDLGADYIKILRSLMSREYEPNPNGADDWFVEAEANRLMTRRLGYPYISYSLIIASGLVAFSNSGYDRYLLHKINTEWETTKEQLKREATDKSDFDDNKAC